jgi:hypothetical protein
MPITVNQLAPQLQARIKSELKPDETIVWLDQPSPRYFFWGGCFLAMFFIPMLAISLYLLGDWNSFSLIFVLPPLLFGLAGMSIPIWSYHRAKYMVYLITNQRAFSIEGIKSYIVDSYSPEKLSKIRSEEKNDGSGHLILASTIYNDGEGQSRTKEHGFYAISDVKKVEAMIHRLASTGL